MFFFLKKRYIRIYYDKLHGDDKCHSRVLDLARLMYSSDTCRIILFNSAPSPTDPWTHAIYMYLSQLQGAPGFNTAYYFQNTAPPFDNITACHFSSMSCHFKCICLQILVCCCPYPPPPPFFFIYSFIFFSTNISRGSF